MAQFQSPISSSSSRTFFSIPIWLRDVKKNIASEDSVMEGSSTTSPSGEPIVAMATTYAPMLSAMESVNSAQNQDFSNGSSFAEINSPMLVITDSSTLKKKQ
ncbi:uncharacterized protein [Triticum aestivum]|uniref:uncharacterized protein n=1 Tax=Triticum aestivum TaxID=4565 RepID=UPI001D003FF7|nr:uncharacterized protein LOC123177763 [Triticum aestivum]